MSEPNSEGRDFRVRTDSVLVRPDGQQEIGWTSSSSGEMSREEVREAVADTYGVDPECITVAPRRGRNKATASFGEWNSPWQPGKPPPGDPSLN